jgi:asparagine synthase (glutamine-hydrolysing)
MCGLAGRFHPATLPDAAGWRSRAGALLAHRGPDGSGCYRDERCELVHRRLALIDRTSTGRQPMSNEDGSVLVVYNGEIYNHPELRADLQRRGHVFRGTSDTEVLPHLYEEYGQGVADRLRGIFAFAIYDRSRRRLLLVRDRYGVKPLFYARVDGQWVFASEIKAITALPSFRPALDRQACYDFLGLGYVPEPATGFANIFALSPGNTLTVTPEGHRMTGYHTVDPTPDAFATLDATVDALEARLQETVKSQAVADVPVAALLSGGIDSSLVVAAHRRASGSATATFNVRFPDPRHDETTVAHAVATHCGTEHHTIDCRERSLTPDALLDLVRHFDQPFADTSYIPMYCVSAAVREQSIVCALSGDGGDEVFGGYSSFWRANRLAQLMAAPPWVLGALRAGGRRLSPWTEDLGRQIAKAAALAEAGRRDPAALLAGLANYLSEDQKAALVAPAARDGLLPSERLFQGYPASGRNGIETLSRQITKSLFSVSLPSDMLRKVDMMSMRASIEVRVPLLDDDLVALGLALPHRLKTDGRRGKLALRALARRWLPASVARHPKHGFTIPLDVMTPPALPTALDDLLLGNDARTRPFVDRGTVRQWLRAFAAGRSGRSGAAISREGLYQRVFMLLSLELWLRDHGLTW